MLVANLTMTVPSVSDVDVIGVDAVDVTVSLLIVKENVLPVMLFNSSMDRVLC